jgi:sulfate adenylyltransferase
MGEEDFISVCETMRLRDGTLWPIPIILDMTEAEADTIRSLGKTTITLKNANDDPIGILHVAEIYPFDKNLFNQSVYGTQENSHP